MDARACGTTAGMSDQTRRNRFIALVAFVVVSWLVRELVIWVGYSWLAGTVTGVVVAGLGAIMFLSRRQSKH